MAKSLSERIAMSCAASPTGKRANHVAFLAMRDEIKDAIDAGWPLKLIWQQLKEEQKINCCYTTFLNLTKKLLPSKKEKPQERIKKSAPSKSEPRTFNFNPTPNIQARHYPRYKF